MLTAVEQRKRQAAAAHGIDIAKCYYVPAIFTEFGRCGAETEAFLAAVHDT